MIRTLLALLLCGSLVACDTNDDGCHQQAAGGYAEAEINGETTCLLTFTRLFYTNDVFIPEQDSLLTLGLTAALPDGFRYGTLFINTPFRGIGTYEIERTELRGGYSPDGPDSLFSYARFYDVHHDVGVATFGVDPEEPFRLEVTGYDPASNEIAGTFSGTFTFQDGRSSDDPLRNFRTDTLRVERGAFAFVLERWNAGG